MLTLVGPGGIGKTRLAIATAAHMQAGFAHAEWRRIGDPRLTAVALNNLSWMAVRLGRYDEARAALEESVLLNTSIGDRWNLGFAYRGLGLIAQAQGAHLQAVDRKSLGTLTELGAPGCGTCAHGKSTTIGTALAPKLPSFDRSIKT